jgi:hypothetical protein
LYPAAFIALLIAAPMPRVPPVTNATRAMSNSSLVVFFMRRNDPGL